jgi:tricorn protease
MLLSRTLRPAAAALATLLCCSLSTLAQKDAAKPGYYRFPAVHGETIVFTSEGDLWTVSVHGGQAQRLTSDAGSETMATIAPDGKTVAFAGQLEGPTDVYTIPITGGLPQRRTWDGDARPVGWAADGRLMVSTRRYSTLPDVKLTLIDSKGKTEVLPLAGAAEASYSANGRDLFFTRWNWQGSSTKRYKGGTAENIWRYDGKSEAVPLTADYTGTSREPMVWNGRVYFLSDRDGIMNVFSMGPDGKGLKQESHQTVFDVQAASIDDGKLVYACAGDLHFMDLKSDHDEIIPVTLESDFDQLRDHWVKKPLEFLTDVHLAPDGGSAVFTSRGEVFTLPSARTGRIVKIAGDSGVRYRDAIFMPDGKSILTISTETGETEFWKFPANGIGKPEKLTSDSKIQRVEGNISPDGKWLAHTDKDQQLWLLEIASKKDKRIAQSMNGDFNDLSWSPDSRWLAFTETANNTFTQIKVLNVESGAMEALTSDRYNSLSPAWSSDGKWLYYLSDRLLRTTVPSPWGSRQPDPHFDRSMKIYELALTTGLRSPFLPFDELHPESAAKKDDEKAEKDKAEKAKEVAKAEGDKKPADAAKADEKKADDKKEDESKKVPEVKIDFTNLADRLSEVPAPAGNYDSLQATEKRLCWASSSSDFAHKRALQCLDIANKGDELETVAPEINSYEISLDRKKMLITKGEEFYIFDSDLKSMSDPKTVAKASIDLSRWTITTDPREEFRGFFDDAWRMHRDYFYDRHMSGVDWVAMRERYRPLVDRVADRDELNDVIAQMVGELSTLHTFVVGGDGRGPSDDIGLASLGAQLERDEKAGGYRVAHIYAYDPDLPNTAPPLARPDSTVKEGEVIVSIDGQSLLGVPDERVLLRGKAGSQVLLQVKSAAGELRSVLVTPIPARAENNLAYSEWEYTRRLKVDSASSGKIGYVHLRAMGTGDMEQWERDFYPVFDRQGLIIDVRHNQGGNIDSWLLAKLLRQAWMYWQPPVGNPQWNMPYAFRGHIVVLCDEWTASDGEAFSEGFKRLHLGPVLGTRTWGGEVWLGFDNFQADGGIASAAELGVYGPEGKWLIEGHGVDPDVVVDNLPHATYEGSDAQLAAAIKLLDEEIKKDPRPVPKAPPYPDKSFKNAK